MADILTGIRILCGLLLLLFPPFSPWYYALLLLGGFTDAIDGTVARRLGKDSSFGASFDTIADFVFLLCIIGKLAFTISIPFWILIWGALIAVIKIFNVLCGFFRYRRLVTVHSRFNKACGITVFISLFLIGFDIASAIKVSAIGLTCLFATACAILEMFSINNKKSTPKGQLR